MLLYVAPPPRVVLPADVSAVVAIVREDRVTLVADKGSSLPDPGGFHHLDDDYRKLRTTSSSLALAAVGTATFNTETGVIDPVDLVSAAVDTAPTPGDAALSARSVLDEIAPTITWVSVSSEDHALLGVNTETAFLFAGVRRGGGPEAWLTVLGPNGTTRVQSTDDIVVLAPPVVQEELESAAKAVRAEGPEGEAAALASAIRKSAPKTLRTAPINPDCHSVTIFANGHSTADEVPPPNVTVPRH